MNVVNLARAVKGRRCSCGRVTPHATAEKCRVCCRVSRVERDATKYPRMRPEGAGALRFWIPTEGA